MRIKLVLLLIALVSSLCLIVNPAQADTFDVWETKASLHVARSSLGAAVVDGAIYAIGGVLDPPSYVTCTGVNEKYDPLTNQWTIKASMPTKRASFATAVVDSKIFCIGGATGLEDGQVMVSNVNEVYDPTTDTWTTKTNMPTPRAGVTAQTVDGKIYVFGGNSTITEVYDPASDSWTTKASMPYPLGFRMLWSCSSAKLDDKVHVFGACPYSVSHQVYDPATDKWTIEKPIVQGYLLASAASTGSLGCIWVFGVDSTWWDNGPPSFSSLTWDSKTGCWRVSSLMLTPRVNAAVATIGDTVYVIGGSIVMIENNAHPTTIVEAYSPQNDCPVNMHPPEIIIQSPKATTYTETVTINFTVNKPTVNIKLGIDGQELCSVSGNTTLTFQPGNHNVTVYAVDQSGNIGTSNTVNFVISAGEYVAFSSTVLFLVGFGALFFFVGVAFVWCYKKKDVVAKGESVVG